MNKLMTKTKMQLVNYKRKFGLGIVQRSPYENIYHCCTQKTASQWFKAIFTSGPFYRYTGLLMPPYRALGLRTASFDQPFPKRTIAAHLYISYPTYLSIPKPSNYKTFFVMRDPRDTVVSWYFSTKFSHAPIEPIPTLRKELEKLDLKEGLKFSIDRLEEFGLFEAQRSWVEQAAHDSTVKVFLYEDLASDHHAFLRSLFDYLSIDMPEPEFNAVCESHRYERFSKGRNQGSENLNDHYRKGVAGDWQNHFDEATLNYFQHVTKDLVEVLGYQD